MEYLLILINQKEKNEPIFGEIKLKEAIYTYPDGLKIDNIINELLVGKKYTRTKNY